MEIKGKINVQGYLRIEDLDAGETFAFLNDDSTLYLTTDDFDKIVDLYTGALVKVTSLMEECPIKRVSTTLYINEVK